MIELRARVIGAAALFIFATAGCDSLPGKPNVANRPRRPSEINDFVSLFSENCSGCHGSDGKFGAAIALNNPEYLAIVSDAELSSVIARGRDRSAMPAFAASAGGSLTDEQIAILVSGMRQRWSGGTTPEGAPAYATSTPGDADRGAAVAREFCSLCHGSPLAGPIDDPSFLALVSDQYLRTIVIAGRPDLGHPDWRGDVLGKPLSSQQVADVVAWLASKRPSYAIAETIRNP